MGDRSTTGTFMILTPFVKGSGPVITADASSSGVNIMLMRVGINVYWKISCVRMSLGQR
jgi:hypothetical protein